MVIKPLLFAICMLLTNSILARDLCTKGSEFEPPLCPVLLPKIKSIHIEENGAKAVASQDSSVDCSTFKLSKKQVRRYLARAKQTNELDAHHTLDWSPCYASGRLEFIDGQRADWSINQLRTGSLNIAGKANMFLYCPTCKFTPFQ